ncbi:MAG: hypothetical protein R3B09_09695 [Nannocystaceae bacterium]
MPRLHQDTAWEADVAIGRPLLRLCALVDPGRGGAVCLVFARLDHPAEWHRLFVDVGLAFWETWPDEAIDAELEDDDALARVELLEGRLPLTIVGARAFEAAPGRASRIVLSLGDGSSVELRCDGDEVDAPMRVIVDR